MSIIGYLRRCRTCEIQMLVTVAHRHATYCDDCLEQVIREAIDVAAADDDDYPIGGVTA